MKVLRKRYISFPCPVASMRGVHGHLIPSEESVRLWLSAFPGLVGWEQGINWLSTGIAESRRKSREGLWGMDPIGSLLIAEITIDRGDAPDPFEKFVQYVKSASMQRKWKADALDARCRKYARTNSYAQEAIKQLQLAYCASFVPLIGSDSYQRSISQSLEIRDAVGNPPPVFVGVVAAQPDFHLSPKALKNLELLQKHVGSERVLLRVISARLTPKGLLYIECRSPETDEVSRVITRPLR